MTDVQNILVATNQLNKIGGSETFAFSLIEELKKREFVVEYFTFLKGAVSQQIEEKLGVQFMSRKKYDLILANHQTCIELLFTRGYIIQICHGIFPYLEQPSKYADFHIAISQEVQDHLKKKNFKSRKIYNGIDCERFKPEKKIKPKLTTILSLCQSNSANAIIKEICREHNLSLLVINKFETQVWEVEKAINKSDLVIGLGRSIYEAMASGRPVVIYDHRPYSKSFGDGYLDANNIKESIKNNCSGRRFKFQFSKGDLVTEIFKYDLKTGDFLRNFALKNLNITSMVDEYLEIFLAEQEKNRGFKRDFRKLMYSMGINKKKKVQALKRQMAKILAYFVRK
ncbi:hypothetical protein APR41_11995 [Salegentibacter salinarum]|uniref:UDP-glycosyltransferase n=1 Tax=Salegentibacter salinarum TaxID=447422 RepID=A0A2N0U299_9FLAO|nr:hypothetical protein [Salegentibacter salinarum]PKD21130.1 hypothetical protein APR41_11995 [Salegentibacter salinarum]SKB76285.1 hypothetical protein SAMN05660903_02446 [Salegentibacter salinarum]